MAEQLGRRSARLWRDSPAASRVAVATDSSRPPRVIVSPIDPPFVHPLSKRDVQLVVTVLPAACTGGLRSVSLLGPRELEDGTPVFASYRRMGFLRLHAVSSLPWLMKASAHPLATELRQYGAEVETLPDGAARVTWPGDSLRLFYALGVLLAGVARNRREQEGKIDFDSNVRWLAAQEESWRVSDEALRQWADLLRRSGAA